MEVIGAILLIALVTAHIPFFAERYLFDPLWDKFYNYCKIVQRRDLAIRRCSIIARAESVGLSHQHLDQTLAEFILFNNTSFWLFAIAMVRVIGWPHNHYLGIVACVILAGSLATLLFACPFFKKSYLDILEVLEQEVNSKRKQIALASTTTPAKLP